MTLAEPLTISAGVHEYARSVVDGDIVTGELVQQACQRHLDDLEHGAARGIYFDERAADHALQFFSFLKHSDGRWKGQTFILSPWQVFVVGSLFGWKREDGTRRFRTGYVEVARKNGKSALAGGIGDYMAFFDDEGRAEVYSAATKTDQAKIVFEAGMRLARSLPEELKAGLESYRTAMVGPDGSSFKPVSKQHDTLDGLNIHCALVDELHAHKNRELVDVLRTAMGARRQPLMLYITTAGYGHVSACWDEHKYSERLLAGEFENDAYFAYIASMDAADDWKDEANWVKANPNLGVSVTLENLNEEFAEALESPTKQNSFRNKRLNQWTEQAIRWMSMEKWDACDSTVDVKSLRGRPCYAGVDLSTKIDISAVVLVFPPRSDNEPWQILPKFYVPEDTVRARSSRDRVPYDVWARQKHITPTEGAVVDFDRIVQDVVNMSKREGFLIQEIGYDPWNATQFAIDLTGEGFKVVEVRQGARSLSEPMKLLEAMTIDGKIAHGGNPVLRWMMSNVAIRTDANENIAPDKDKSTERIDGVVALTMALSRAIVGQEQGQSVYAGRGFAVLG